MTEEQFEKLVALRDELVVLAHEASTEIHDDGFKKLDPFHKDTLITFLYTTQALLGITSIRVGLNAGKFVKPVGKTEDAAIKEPASVNEAQATETPTEPVQPGIGG